MLADIYPRIYDSIIRRTFLVTIIDIDRPCVAASRRKTRALERVRATRVVQVKRPKRTEERKKTLRLYIAFLLRDDRYDRLPCNFNGCSSRNVYTCAIYRGIGTFTILIYRPLTVGERGAEQREAIHSERDDSRSKTTSANVQVNLIQIAPQNRILIKSENSFSLSRRNIDVCSGRLKL